MRVDLAQLRFSRIHFRPRSERLQFNSDKNLSADLGLPGIPFGPKNGGLPAFTIDDLTSFGSSTFSRPHRAAYVSHWHSLLVVE
jgi:hypothetical protein